MRHVPPILEGSARGSMRCGILIIGSLLWQETKRRPEWRELRLDLDHKVEVKAPIRYGRISSDWGCAFTMTLDGDPGGTAILVPCKNEVNGIEALTTETEALWKAERPKAGRGDIADPWGCVGLMFRPEGDFETLPTAWAEYFTSKVSDPIQPVDGHGVLGIPWPVEADGAPLEIDLVLATATKPRPETSRPEANEIADAWIEQDDGNEQYFLENVANGIRTSNDLEIWRRIEERKPRWLTRQDVIQEAIDLLRKESGGSA